MKKILYSLLLCRLIWTAVILSCEQKKTPAKKDKTTVILVHSAWLGGWQWKETITHLKDEQLKLIATDLPGHGKDKTPPNEITMEDCVDHLIKLIDAEEKPVVLVGHSFNGITISRVAELRPKKVKKLIYLTAFLVPNGTSFFSAVEGVEGSKALENFYLSEDKSYALVKEDALHEAFAHDIPLENFIAAKPYIVPEPTAPLSYALEVSEGNLGQIPKYYIECTEDKAIPIAIQRAMYRGKVKKYYSLASSHTPNFSKPDSLAYLLKKIVLK